MKLLYLLTFLLFIPPHIAAQEAETIHPIDTMLEECLNEENNYTTTGMVECTQKAYDAWDNELNSVYKKLMAELNDNEKSALKKAQVEWLKFRDLEFYNIDSIYDKMEGTMWIPVRLNEKLQVVKTRVLQLDGYVKLLSY